MAFYTTTLSTDGSGDGNGNFGDFQPRGLVVGIRAELVSGLSTVDITIAEGTGLKRTILNGVTATTTTNYNPMEEIQDNTGTGVGSYVPYLVDIGSLVITLANGTVSQTDKLILTVNILEE